MPVLAKPFPEFGVTLNIFSGVVTPDDMLRFAAEVERIEGARWVNYLGPTLDLSGVDVAHIPIFKRAITERLHALYGDSHVRSAFVTASPANLLVLNFWPSYVGLDPQYPIEPAAFSTLEAACAGLGLTEPACRAVSGAVSAS